MLIGTEKSCLYARVQNNFICLATGRAKSSKLDQSRSYFLLSSYSVRFLILISGAQFDSMQYSQWSVGGSTHFFNVLKLDKAHLGSSLSWNL